jgi:hypothetical protein
MRCWKMKRQKNYNNFELICFQKCKNDVDSGERS